MIQPCRLEKRAKAVFMSERSDFNLQVLQFIAAPLLGSVLAYMPEGKAPDDEQVAKAVAGLLAKSVQAGIEMGSLVELDKQGDKADALRVSLVGVASQMLSGMYTANGAIAEEAELKRLQDGLKSVIGFADNFASDEASQMRLQGMEAVGFPADIPQSYVQYLQAFVPVILAVSEFSFGKGEAQLLSEIASRLGKNAQEIVDILGAGSQSTDPKLVERGVLKALGQLYAQCHKAQVVKLSAQGPEGGPGLDQVWQAYDTQVQMMLVLAKGLNPDAPSSAASGGGAPVPEASESPASNPVTPPATAPVTPPMQATSPAPPPSQAGTPAAEGNPMSFFGKKPDEGAEQNAPPPPTSVQPPVSETPPASPSQPETPPAAPPPSSDVPPAEEDQGEQPKGDKSNPMSFFSKKPDDEA